MLYERWCRIAVSHGNDLALRDLASGRSWTFGELRNAGEARAAADGAWVHPQGQAPEFILDLLAAWRSGKIVCPLEAGQPPPIVTPPPAGCIHLKTTSATTGAPRLVAFTAVQLAADAEHIVATMGLRPDWPNLGVISLAHSYGFSNLVLPLLLHGIPLVWVPSPLPEVVKRAVGSESAVTLAAVPALWRAWHEAGAIAANIRLAVSAGAPLPLGLEKRVFENSGLKIHNFYGSTECGGIAYDDSDVPRGEEGLAGRPMIDVALSVEDGGCLAVRGVNVAETYWPERDDALGGSRFQTRDLAELREGTVILRGRSGDAINMAGRKVSPETIEAVLHQHPGVRSCLVFGVPSGETDRFETIVACVEAPSSLPTEDLRQFMLARLPAWQVPRQWWFVDSLAINPRGKVSRADWRERFLREFHRRR
jgi:acyl-CoA synthetase (AMP-forming)/AMP-acid ligase II